jgi:hypothetical protein
MAFLPRYYLADISQIEYRIAGQVQYFSRPRRRQQFGDAPHRALPIRAPAAANNGSAT